MRKVTFEVTAKVPSWHFCNNDKNTLSLKVSSDLCRFCCKDKNGYRCTLYDTWLSADRRLVNKAPQCIKNDAWSVKVVTQQEIKEAHTVAPQQIAEATIQGYLKIVEELMQQGYPRRLAEPAAKQLIMEEYDV